MNKGNLKKIVKDLSVEGEFRGFNHRKHGHKKYKSKIIPLKKEKINKIKIKESNKEIELLKKNI